MLMTVNPAPRRRRIALLLGAAGVTALLAAALPELTAAGEATYAGVLTSRAWVGGADTNFLNINNWTLTTGGSIATADILTIGTTTNSPTLSTSAQVTSVAINGADTLTLSGASTVLTSSQSACAFLRVPPTMTTKSSA